MQCCSPISLLSTGLKIEMQIIIFCGRRLLFCPEIILSCNAVPSYFYPLGLQIPAPGISSFAKCPSMVSQIQQCYVSLWCHPASTSLSLHHRRHHPTWRECVRAELIQTVLIRILCSRMIVEGFSFYEEKISSSSTKEK